MGKGGQKPPQSTQMEGYIMKKTIKIIVPMAVALGVVSFDAHAAAARLGGAAAQAGRQLSRNAIVPNMLRAQRTAVTNTVRHAVNPMLSQSVQGVKTLQHAAMPLLLRNNSGLAPRLAAPPVAAVPAPAIIAAPVDDHRRAAKIQSLWRMKKAQRNVAEKRADAEQAMLVQLESKVAAMPEPVAEAVQDPAGLAVDTAGIGGKLGELAKALFAQGSSFRWLDKLNTLNSITCEVLANTDYGLDAKTVASAFASVIIPWANTAIAERLAQEQPADAQAFANKLRAQLLSVLPAQCKEVVEQHVRIADAGRAPSSLIDVVATMMSIQKAATQMLTDAVKSTYDVATSMWERVQKAWSWLSGDEAE